MRLSVMGRGSKCRNYCRGSKGLFENIKRYGCGCGSQWALSSEILITIQERLIVVWNRSINCSMMPYVNLFLPDHKLQGKSQKLSKVSLLSIIFKLKKKNSCYEHI